jgi:LysM repeat protein
MIKLTTLLKEQRYKYKWLELLDYNVPKDAVTGYRLNMKERGKEAEIDESDLKYFLDDNRFASKYKNKNYVFWVEEKRGGRKRRVYIVYVYSTSNLPADIQIYLDNKTTPHYSLNGAPVYFSLKAEREGGILKGADAKAAELAAAEAAAKERELKVDKEVAKIDADAEKTDTEIETSIYKVVAGDTLAKIAKKHGMTLNDIMQLNPQIQDPNKIFPGQSINVSGEAVVSPEVDVDKEKDIAPETDSGVRITAGYAISPRIQKIAKDLYDAANYIGGTDEQLFDSAFDQIKNKQEVHRVNLEIARLEKDADYDLEEYILGEFSFSEEDIRLEKLAKLIGKDSDGKIIKTDSSLLQQAADQGKQESLANIDISTLGRYKPGDR